MKRMLFLVLAAIIALPAVADEGMWLPLFLKRLNYRDMQKHGLKLSADELYDINNGSLKDAIVSLGGFCTGEIISPEGLMLTNHHCGFDAIANHSSVEHDYLEDGFWAMDRSQELPNDGLFVNFLVYMQDVSSAVNAKLNASLSNADREKVIKAVSDSLVKLALDGHSTYNANVKSFYHGNEFYLFVYEKYDDVRLVGAPPSSVGKFGGDTDNWMWPRHTGDFSMFRIYMGADGKPAKFSQDNVPLKPKHFLPISMNGVKEGDFSMIFGYPGSTDRYLSSYGVQQAIDKYNPTVVKVRDLKLAIMKAAMDADKAVKIQLASDYASTANYWKYYIGQTEQLKNNKVYDKKVAIENDFREWMAKDPARQEKYGKTLELLENAYKASDNWVVGDVYLREAGLFGPKSTLYTFRAKRLVDAYVKTRKEMQAEGADAAALNDKLVSIKNAILSMTDAHYHELNIPTEQRLIAELWSLYHENVAPDQQPASFATIAANGGFDKYADSVMNHSIFTSKERMIQFIDSPDSAVLANDGLAKVVTEMINMYFAGSQSHAATDEDLETGYRLLTAGIREMNPDIKFAPDANSTMRVTYGNVLPYTTNEGVDYPFFTTADDILKKEDPNNPEFVVPAKLHTLIENKDFGQYADKKGNLPVCFISNTDITGGNSGSPVINGRGELIGCAFDGNWEAMSGDIAFEPNLQRTIAVDIRYVLFIIDKYAGASHLIDEMTLVKRKKFLGIF